MAAIVLINDEVMEVEDFVKTLKLTGIRKLFTEQNGESTSLLLPCYRRHLPVFSMLRKT